jgi:alpha-tubulin suppressor-like RCC1 family protein
MPVLSSSPRALALRAALVLAAGACGGDAPTTPPVHAVRVTPSEVTLARADSLRVAAVTLDASERVLAGPSVVWQVRDSNVATITAAGMLHARAVGRTTLLATAGGASTEVPVTVTPAPVVRIVVTPDSVTLRPGDRTRATALLRDAAGDVDPSLPTWTSADSTIATVDRVGGIQGVRVGRTTVAVTAGAARTVVHVTVVARPSTLYASPAQNVLLPGLERPLVAYRLTGRLGAPDTLVAAWTSRTPAVATVDERGVVRAVAPGEALIVARVGTDSVEVPVTVRTLGAPTRYLGVAAGGAFACGLDVAGAPHCWGTDAGGQLGLADPVDRCEFFVPAIEGREPRDVQRGVERCAALPTRVAGAPPLATLWAGISHVCGLTPDRAVHCWGANADGRTGIGRTSGVAGAPQRVAVPTPVRQVSAGVAHSCAATEAGTAYCWGSGFLGQLGTGTTGSGSATPVRVAGETPFEQVVAAAYHSCGLATDGRAWCWGEHRGGQLGIGDSVTTCRGSTEPLNCTAAPVAVRGGVRFTALVAGGRSTCGLDRAGAAHCWGSDLFVPNRFPAPIEYTVPRPIAAPVPFVSLSLAIDGQQACALDASGAAWCWGPGAAAGAPPGTAARALPGVALASLSLGSGVGCGMGRDGLAYCWGGNTVGQLGVGRFDPSVPSAPIASPPSVVRGQR